MTLAGVCAILFGIWALGLFMIIMAEEDEFIEGAWQFVWKPYAVTIIGAVILGLWFGLCYGVYQLLNSVRL